METCDSDSDRSRRASGPVAGLVPPGLAQGGKCFEDGRDIRRAGAREGREKPPVFMVCESDSTMGLKFF